MAPIEAIMMLCDKALADDSKSAGYRFYQTTKGFHFRSFESMCADSRGMPREFKQEFNYMPMNNPNEQITGKRYNSKNQEVAKVVHDYTSVESYKFINNFHDVAMNQAIGTYGHRVITHNLFNKSYKVSDYHYHDYFTDTKHTDGPNPAVVDTPVDFDNKGVSDYPESRVTVMPTTQYTHGEKTGAFGIDVEQDGITEASIISQRAAVEAGTRLKLTVKGQSYLEPGDLIQFNILSVENKVISEGALDPHFSGRYVISKIRHRVTNDEYIQVLECVKDSVFNAYTSDGESSYQGHKLPREYSVSKDISEFDNTGKGPHR